MTYQIFNPTYECKIAVEDNSGYIIGEEAATKIVEAAVRMYPNGLGHIYVGEATEDEDIDLQYFSEVTAEVNSPDGVLEYLFSYNLSTREII